VHKTIEKKITISKVCRKSPHGIVIKCASEPKRDPLVCKQTPAAAVAKALDYMLTRWPAFTRFLDEGRICMTTNGVEKGKSSARGHCRSARRFWFGGFLIPCSDQVLVRLLGGSR